MALFDYQIELRGQLHLNLSLKERVWWGHVAEGHVMELAESW